MWVKSIKDFSEVLRTICSLTVDVIKPEDPKFVNTPANCDESKIYASFQGNSNILFNQ
jgi:hypothetical protein